MEGWGWWNLRGRSWWRKQRKRLKKEMVWLGWGRGFDHLLVVVVGGDFLLLFYTLISHSLRTNKAKVNGREEEKRLQGIDEELSEEIARSGASQSHSQAWLLQLHPAPGPAWRARSGHPGTHASTFAFLFPSLFLQHILPYHTIHLYF